MRNLIFIAMAVAFSFKASARPEYLEEMQKLLKGKARTISCTTCHISGLPRNAFGKDFEKIFLPYPLAKEYREYNKLSRKDKWKLLLSWDSNKNGVSNLDELANGDDPSANCEQSLN